VSLLKGRSLMGVNSQKKGPKDSTWKKSNAMRPKKEGRRGESIPETKKQGKRTRRINVYRSD